MAVAQKLYEAGLITYMRSDAVFVAPEAVASARSYLEQAFGPAVLPEKPPSYSGKEGAQEAHEAVRPSDVFRDLSDAGLDAQQGALYNLILRRFLASQMKPAVIQRTDWRLSGGPEADRVLGVRGRVVLDPGWQAVLPPPSSGDDPPVLPAVEDGAYPVWPAGSFSAELAEGWTKPPKRYTEAALIADLEAKGVGRPSTYAATLEKLLQRGYAFIDKRLFFTTPFGRIVDGHLRRNFPRVRDVTYTSTMEEQLDLVAAGSRRYTELLDIYWDGLQRELAAAQADPQPPGPAAAVRARRRLPEVLGRARALDPERRPQTRLPVPLLRRRGRAGLGPETFVRAEEEAEGVRRGGRGRGCGRRSPRGPAVPDVFRRRPPVEGGDVRFR